MTTRVSTLVLCSLMLLTMQAEAEENRTRVRLSLPSQPLEQALNEFARQTRLIVLRRDEEVSLDGLVAPEVRGEFSPAEALDRMLAASGLKYEFVNDRTVRIASKPAKSAEAEAHDAGGTNREPFRVAQGDQTSGERSPASQQSTTGTGGSESPSTFEKGSERADQLEEIVVTGTHIRGASPQIAPLIVLDRSYIESTGFSTTARLVESLPQNFALTNQSGANVPGVSNSAAQGAGINLRGIGEGATLTLLNGRRPALGFLGRAVDIAALPLSAIERVEVLTDGASAIYGSDAVGGVVNFILRRDFSGLETRLRAGAADGLDEYRVSQAAGGTWDSGNALLALEYYDRDLLRAADRSFVPSASTIGSLLPRDRNISAMFSGRQELSERVEIFADTLYTKRDSYNESGQVLFDESAELENPQLSATAGLNFRFGRDWLLEGAGSYGRNEADQIQAASYGELVVNTLFQIESAEVKADGSLFSLPAGRVRLALGLDWRSESFNFTQTFGPASVSQEFEQTVRSAYTELHIPFIGPDNATAGAQRLEMSVAGRFDEYSNFGSSFDPRLGLIWEPVAGLRVRGSYATSYVAPRLLDYDTSFDSTSINTFADPEAASGISRQLWVFGSDVGSLAPQEARSWSLGLEISPMPSLQLGLNYYDIRYEDKIANPPFPGVILGNPSSFQSLITRDPTVDQVSQAIAIGAAVGRFFDCEFDPIACSPDPNFDPASVAVIVDARRRNLSLMRTNGIDLSVQHGFIAAGGQVQLGINGTHILDIEQQATATSTPFDTVDTVYNPPDWRVRGSLGFQRGSWATNLFVNHTDSYTDNRGLLPEPVDSYTTVDFRLAYDFGERSGFLSGVTLSANALNLFDRDPPATPVLVAESDMGFDPTNASPLGRLVAVELSKSW